LEKYYTHTSWFCLRKISKSLKAEEINWKNHLNIGVKASFAGVYALAKKTQKNNWPDG
jgi:hypothetical protein